VHIRSTSFKLMIGLVGAMILSAAMSTLVINQLSAHGRDSSLIHTCVHDRIGVVKIADSDESCPSGWTALDWDFQGPPGTPGAAGPPGRQGETGKAGLSGTDGAQGRRGASGTAGAAGPQGQRGLTGAQGQRGPDGIAGSRGDNGAVGADGSAGPLGPQGVEGPPGPQGADGQAGASEWVDGSSRVTTTVNVGIGTTNPQEKLHTVGNLRVDGSLIADKLLYRSPRTHYFVVGGEGFLPGRDVGYTNSFGNGGAYLTAVGLSGAMAVPVHLPHGALVKSVVARFNDNSTSDISLTFSCQRETGGYINYASLSSSGITGYGDDTAALIRTIDNSGPCSYHLRAFSSSWDGSNLRVHRVVISYTLGEAP